MQTSLLSSRCCLVALLLFSLPSENRAQGTRATESVRTFAPDSFWVRAWARGGKQEPDLLSEVRLVAFSKGSVAVLDQGNRELSGFDASTGKTLFTRKATGVGPGEFRRPARLATSLSGFSLLDHASGRLTTFDSAGRFLLTRAVPDPFGVEGVCELSSGMILAKNRGAYQSIIASDSSGIARNRASLDSTQRNAAIYSWTSSVVGPNTRGDCAIVPFFGPAWYLRTTSGLLEQHQYIAGEPFPKVNVKVTPRERTKDHVVREIVETTNDPSSTVGASMIGDTLVVQTSAAGKAPFRYGILDYYLLPSGRYIHSRAIPGIVNGITAGPNGLFFAVRIDEDNSSLIAIRTSRTPPPAAPTKRR